MKTMKYIATVLMLLSMTSCELERLDYTEISPESSQYDEWYYVLSKENYNARNSNKHDSEYCLPQ